MSIAVVDTGSGNLRSVAKALTRAVAESGRADQVLVTADPDQIRRAERIVLPGVGAFADCLRGLGGLPGLREVLEEQVIAVGRPFLGICVGMQLMAEWGREHGNHRGLGWLAGEVVPLVPGDTALKVPHMGWNELLPRRDHPLLAGIPAGAHAYFVHSFHFKAAPDALCAETHYGGSIAAMVARDNLAGTQFHPEKSQAVGLRLIANFLGWRP